MQSHHIVDIRDLRILKAVAETCQPEIVLHQQHNHWLATQLLDPSRHMDNQRAWLPASSRSTQTITEALHCCDGDNRQGVRQPEGLRLS